MNDKGPLVVGVWLQVREGVGEGQGILRVISRMIAAATASGGARFVIATHENVRDDFGLMLKTAGCDMGRVEFVTVGDRTPHRGPGRLSSLGGVARNRLRSWAGMSWERPNPPVPEDKTRGGRHGGFCSTDNKQLTAAPLAASVGWLRRLTSRLVLQAPDATTEDRPEISWVDTLAGELNKREVAAVYVPNASFDGALKLRAPLVVAVWDVFFYDYPFLNWPVKRLLEQVGRVVGAAKYVITMGHYVRERHVVARSLCAPDKVLTARVPRFEPPPAERFRTQDAESILETYLSETSGTPSNYQPFLVDFPIHKVPFLLVATQVRPHKNLINLIAAFGLLIRKYRRVMKLVLTGSIYDDPAVSHLCLSLGLGLDVVCLPQVPNVVLRSLFSKAKLTVIPSFIEGGLPLNLETSLSAGVPVALADMPEVRASLPDDSITDSIFDPNSIDSIADVIRHCLDNSSELFARQVSVVSRLYSEVSWDSYASLHLGAFQAARDAV